MTRSAGIFAKKTSISLLSRFSSLLETINKFEYPFIYSIASKGWGCFVIDATANKMYLKRVHGRLNELDDSFFMTIYFFVFFFYIFLFNGKNDQTFSCATAIDQMGSNANWHHLEHSNLHDMYHKVA